MSDDIIIGGYRRVNVLQTGQNSEVWEVTELDGRGRYAMKLLLPERMDDADHRRHLKHEAAVGKTLQHPRIIKFFKYRRDRVSPYILMEFFPSQNLKIRLMRGQHELFIKPKLRMLIEQTAQALDYLHGKGWVHQDIKPDNVLVNTSGEIRLIDFALSTRSASGFARRFLRRRKVTAGTRSYMSPEQIRGIPVDFRSDIYSFGVMLYELASGRVPFVASTGNELLQKHLYAPPPIIDKSRGLTPEFQELIYQSLSKKEENRPQRFSDVLDALRRIKLFIDEPDVDPQSRRS